MPVAQIQATVDAIHALQVNNEVARNGYALLFKSSVHGSAAAPLQMKVATTPSCRPRRVPADVAINGKIEVYNRCLDGGGTSNCHSGVLDGTKRSAKHL